MVFEWTDLDVIRAILFLSTSIPLLLFSSAGTWHFGGRHQSGTWLVTTTSALGYVSVLYAIFTSHKIYLWSALGVALHLSSTFLFGWCIGTSGKRNLGLALNDNSSGRLITDGPYAFVRHPFYTSYIIFWAGSAVIAPSIFTIIPAAALLLIYFYTARREDKALAKLFEDEYPSWYRNTGAFFPKWR
jgi:protein-S-isoprenylcysteine O-methyltransferase Ste14